MSRMWPLVYWEAREDKVMDWDNDEYVRAVVRHLGYVRQWIEGFEAGGKKGPPYADALRKAQLLIEKKIK